MRRSAGWLGLVLLAAAAPGARAQGLLEEVGPDFWRTNLVAAVVGYEYEQEVYGVTVPSFSPRFKNENPRATWFRSIAPTNQANISFSLHRCSPGDHREMFPTNRLFVFPVGVDDDDRRSWSERGLEAISPQTHFMEFCEYRTFEKCFPVSRQDVDFWVGRLENSREEAQRELHQNQKKLSEIDPGDTRLVKRLKSDIAKDEKWLQDSETRRARYLKQTDYLPKRAEWLRTQNVKVPE
ncbi:MAG: hypothetical protein LBW77_01715 [Verrucomicrobiota bacterium]|nr:hypothetical protein [Verrucomicrobiota bacterium]